MRSLYVSVPASAPSLPSAAPIFSIHLLKTAYKVLDKHQIVVFALFKNLSEMAILSNLQTLPLSIIAFYTVAIYLASKIVIIVQRVFFHPLSRVPGPAICATSRLYEFWWDSVHHGRLWSRMPKLHEKYGTFTRISENFD